MADASNSVRAPTFVLFMDSLLSDQVQQFIRWTGVFSNVSANQDPANQARPESSNSQSAAVQGTGQNGDGPWYILSNLKWGMLENITGATLRNPDVRDAFITFLSSECGDIFKANLDSGAYIAATQSRGVSLPVTVLEKNNQVNSAAAQLSNALASGAGGALSVIVGSVGGNTAANTQQVQYQTMPRALKGAYVPTPRSLRRLLSTAQGGGAGTSNPTGSLKSFAQGLELKDDDDGKLNAISCMEYFYIIVQAFRWEAGHTYWQVLRAAPVGLDQKDVVRTLFYGWEVREKEGQPVVANGRLMTFMRNLIMAFTVKNELAFAPAVADMRSANSQQARQYVDTYAEKMGAKSKFGEVYQWAVLLPYVQGVLYFMLLVGFPFVAMLIVLPGYWKVLMTWVSFFAWIKLWDLGFAMVHVIERSVWAMVGNHSSFASMAQYAIGMEKYGSIGVSCPNSGLGGGSGGGGDWMATKCAVPDVCHVNGNGSVNAECQSGGGASSAGPGSKQKDTDAMGTFDRAMIIGAGSDIGVSNAYYLYIMAALYFAIPAVTGQMVLGARAGAAGFVNTMIGGVAQQAGGAASTGYSGAVTTAAMSNQSSVGQASFAKAMRASTRLGEAYDTGNEGLRLKRDASLKQNLAGAANAEASAFSEQLGAFASKWHLDSTGSFPGAPAGIADPRVTGRGAQGGRGGGGGGGDAGYASNPLWHKGRQAGRIGGGLADAALARVPGAGWLATAMGGAQTAVDLAATQQYGDMDQYSRQGKINASAKGVKLGFTGASDSLNSEGKQVFAGRQFGHANYEAEMASWEAKNQFASDVAAMGAVAGFSAGQLAPGPKPVSQDGMALSGYFNTRDSQGRVAAGYDVSGSAAYAGTGYVSGNRTLFGIGGAVKADSVQRHWEVLGGRQDTLTNQGAYYGTLGVGGLKSAWGGATSGSAPKAYDMPGGGIGSDDNKRGR